MPPERRDPVLHYQGHTVTCRSGETVLDALLRGGAPISFSCRSGVCHRCMVRCLDGDTPEAARCKLPQHQQDAGCLLACQCRPTGPMVLAPRSPEHLQTRCLFTALEPATENRWRLTFEPITRLDYRRGELAVISGPANNDECTAVFTSAPDDDVAVTVEFGDRPLPDWLRDARADELEFRLRGPLPAEPAPEPVSALPPDPALWDALGGDTAVRAVLTTFYGKVYADPGLAPFFERVTLDRIIGKQFAFLKENIAGVPVYFGEQPRNTHNWMVITDTLFDHRQGLMLQAMREHGLDDGLIARWARYEEQFRPDIVKYRPWPKRMGDMLVDTERYENSALDEAAVCDYCDGEIPAGTVVRYHLRIGKIGCRDCAPAPGGENPCQP